MERMVTQKIITYHVQIRNTHTGEVLENLETNRKPHEVKVARDFLKSIGKVIPIELETTCSIQTVGMTLDKFLTLAKPIKL